ncbi:MAG TPA: HAD-IB family hydrolase, partial [Cyclobacteriaceae bacterium]|nr:HAD-IB family hydrolase [Cyclobacteriaceae bacterium]
ITKVNHLVLFDFDGTITNRDSLKDFLFFYHGWAKVCLGFIILSPILALFAVRAIPNHLAKQILLRYFFGKQPLIVFNAKCNNFATQHIPKIIRAGALKRIKQHLSNQETVVVVSASPENWVKPWCDSMGLICIATRLEAKENKITGNYSGNNCYGLEKVRRIKEKFNLLEFKAIIAYGDSRGDWEMLELANHKNYKPFQST